MQSTNRKWVAKITFFTTMTFLNWQPVNKDANPCVTCSSKKLITEINWKGIRAFLFMNVCQNCQINQCNFLFAKITLQQHWWFKCSHRRHPVAPWKTSGCMLLLAQLSDQQVNGTTTFSVRAGKAVAMSSSFSSSAEDRFHSRPSWGKISNSMSIKKKRIRPSISSMNHVFAVWSWICSWKNPCVFEEMYCQEWSR